jgi:hypothetical protein
MNGVGERSYISYVSYVSYMGYMGYMNYMNYLGLTCASLPMEPCNDGAW